MSEKRLHFSPEEKVGILKKHLLEKVPVSTLCDQFGIHPTMFHRRLIIDQDLCERLVMAKFRNRLVHLYWEINPEKIFEIVQNNLKDFKLFEKKIVEFIVTL
jgi:hypothetical protein